MSTSKRQERHEFQMQVLQFLLFCVMWLGKRAWRWLAGTKTFREVRWWHVFETALPASVTRATVEDVLTGMGWQIRERDGALDAYVRGDFTVKQILRIRDSEWRRVPVVLVITTEKSQDGATVHLAYRAHEPVLFTEDAMEHFASLATKEFKLLADYLESVQQGHAQQNSGDSGPGCGPADRERLFGADLALLGLKAGASWEQVQAAYREACRKYHPDSHAGGSVAAHLVELAEQRFREIAAAYQRLKEWYAKSCRA